MPQDQGVSENTSQENKTEVSKEMRIGKYRLIEKIGEGQFGNVYKAQRADILEKGCFYAIKIIKNQYRSNFHRFLSDAKILQQFVHDGIAKVIESGWSGPQDFFAKEAYIITEFIPGESLKAAQKHGPIAQDTLIRWAYEIVESIQYLHSHELEHGDLKPTNLQVTWTARYGQSIRVLDSGLGNLFRNPHTLDPNNFRYLSPEQFLSKKSKASDIYVIGILLYEIFSGIYPYSTQETLDFNQWQQIHQLKQPNALNVAGLPAHIADMIMKCLEKEPLKRPKAEDILAILEKEITGIGIPSYIGILGARGSGKTCYLTSLYAQVESSEETKYILEEKCLSLYNEGKLPAATALSAYRLNFRITTEKRFYDIITKDYGGELLAGRRETTNHIVDQELMLEKRQEIYEFFQNARAILILLETSSKENNLQAILNYRNEIYALIDRIATVRDGVRRIEVPVGLVLTKWDRMGEISWDSQKEHDRALQYIQKVDWLRELYEQMKIICPIFEVFPVFSFVGDKPSKDDLRPFNLKTSLVWATDQSDISLLSKAEIFQKENSQDLHAVIENYWRLLHIEKICDPQIRKQLESKFQNLSPQYLQAVNTKITKDEENLRWVIGQYQEFLQTKGIQKEDKEDAQRILEKYYKKFKIEQQKKMYRGAIIASIVLVILAIFSYIGWEISSEYHLRQEIIAFDQGKIEPEIFKEKIDDYSKYQTLSPWRKLRNSAIQSDVRKIITEQFGRAIRESRIYMDEVLPPVPRYITQQFSVDDRDIIAEKLRNAQQQEEKFRERIQKVEELDKIQTRWLKNFHSELTSNSDFQMLQTSVRLQELKQQHTEWRENINYLENLRESFQKKDELIQEKNKLYIRFTQEFNNDKPENCEQDLLESQKLLQELASLQNKVRHYFIAYGNSPFLQEMQKVDEDLSQRQITWYNYSLGLEKIKTAFLAKQELVKSKQNLFEQMALQKHSYQPGTCEQNFKDSQRLAQDLTLLKNKVQNYSGLYPNSPFQEEIKQLQETINKQQETWEIHLQTLQKVCEAFAAKQELFKESQKLFDQNKLGLVSNKPEKWEENIATNKQLEQDSNNLLTKVSNYFQTYNDSPFVSEVRQLNEDLAILVAICKKNLANLAILQGLFQDYLDLIRNAELVPSENDSLGLLRDKKDKLTKTMIQCQQIQQKIAVHSNILPEEINRIWPTQCDEIMPKINDSIRKCHYFIANFDINEIREKGRMEVLPTDTPKTLEEKTVVIQIALENIAKYDTSSSKFIPDDILKLAAMKKSFQNELATSKDILTRRKRTLEDLDIQAQEFGKQWKEIIQKNLSYEMALKKLQNLLNELASSTYLAKLHQENLEKIDREIRSLKAKDIEQYKEIETFIKQFKFLSAIKKIGQYCENQSHYRIMIEELKHYIQNFSCEIDTAIRVLPSPGFEASGPDFKLDITIMYSPNENERLVLLSNTVFTKNDILREVEMGRLSIPMGVMQHSMVIKVIEIDTISNDDYGICEIQITDLLDNVICNKVHKCKSDGTLEIKVEPIQLRAKNNIPKFKEQ